MTSPAGNDSPTPATTITRRSLLARSTAGAGLAGMTLARAPQVLAGAGGSTVDVATRAQDQPVAGGTLVFNGGSNLSGLDPHITGAVVSWYVLDNVFDRLLRLNPDTQEPEPSLAETVESSADGLTHTFTLREGVTFHNGRALVAADVKASFERIQDPDVPAVAKGYFAGLASIEAPDDRTVVMTYSEPYAPLMVALTRLETAIVPIEEVENIEQWDVHPVGTGPYAFDSYVKDQAAVLVRNDQYWEPDLPLLDTIEQRVIVQPETAVVNVQTGDVQVTPVQASDIGTLQEDDTLVVEGLSSNYWAHLSLNTTWEPLTDVKVRQAIRLGINRDDIKELAFFGSGAVSNTLIPDGNPFRAEVDGWGYDPEQARALLQEAGQGSGFSAVLRVSTADAWQLAAAQVIQANLADIGITIEIEQIESTTWFTEVFQNHDFQMSMTSHVSKVDPDLSMFDILHSGELGTKNYTGFSDPEMDAALDAGRISTDPAERMAAYTTAQQIFVERSGYVVLNLQQRPFAWQNEVQGFLLLPTSELRWKEAWLQQ